MNRNGITEMTINSFASDCLLAACLSLGVAIGVVSIPLIVGKIQGADLAEVEPLPAPVVFWMSLGCGAMIGYLLN